MPQTELPVINVFSMRYSQVEGGGAGIRSGILYFSSLYLSF